MTLKFFETMLVEMIMNLSLYNHIFSDFFLYRSRADVRSCTFCQDCFFLHWFVSAFNYISMGQYRKHAKRENADQIPSDGSWRIAVRLSCSSEPFWTSRPIFNAYSSRAIDLA